MNHDLSIILLLFSRLPIYCYVLHKSWKYRNSLVIISAKWLGIMATAGTLGALANTLSPNILIVNLIGTVFAISMFMVGFTARELKRAKE